MRNINLHNSVSKQENSDWSKGAKHQTRKNYKEINLLKKIPQEHIITRVRRRVAQSEFSDSIFLSQQEVHSPPGCQWHVCWLSDCHQLLTNQRPVLRLWANQRPPWGQWGDDHEGGDWPRGHVGAAAALPGPRHCHRWEDQHQWDDTWHITYKPV